jgi:hypothetical protein
MSFRTANRVAAQTNPKIATTIGIRMAQSPGYRSTPYERNKGMNETEISLYEELYLG